MRVENGKLSVDYGGEDLSTVEIGIGETLDGAEWFDAFLDYDEKANRIAFIAAPPSGNKPKRVWIRVDGVAKFCGGVSTG